MGKDLKGKELGTGLRQRKDGRYEARASIHVLKSMYLGKIKQQKDVSYQWQSKQGFCRK